LKIVNLLPTAFLENTLREEARMGLTATPKSLRSKWFQDRQGRALYERITKRPEYYQARAERAILRDVASSIAALTGARTLIQLGSGPSDQTRLLLRALRTWGTLESYVGVDVSESAVAAAGEALEAGYPGLAVRPVVADFEQHLGLPGYPASGPSLVAFLESAIGNMVPTERAAFLARVRSRLRAGDAFLLGADLVKDPDLMIAAYDDSAGVTAAFDKNVLAVLNTRLGADFDLDTFDHIAAWVPETQWIEMRLRSAVEQQVRVPGAGLAVRFVAGEEMGTEIAAKFRRDGLTTELAAAGLAVRAWWTDPAGQFAVSLSVPE
jgi:L-histidine Nalpha-methyltransferase